MRLASHCRRHGSCVRATTHEPCWLSCFLTPRRRWANAGRRSRCLAIPMGVLQIAKTNGFNFGTASNGLCKTLTRFTQSRRFAATCRHPLGPLPSRVGQCAPEEASDSARPLARRPATLRVGGGSGPHGGVCRTHNAPLPRGQRRTRRRAAAASRLVCATASRRARKRFRRRKERRVFWSANAILQGTHLYSVNAIQTPWLCPDLAASREKTTTTHRVRHQHHTPQSRLARDAFF